MTHYPESIAYGYAHNQWERFHASASDLKLGELLQNLEAAPSDKLAAALRVLPALERVPVAFGVFIQMAGCWSPMEQTLFLGEFLPGPSAVERRILEAAARGALKVPGNLPVTLEEFPSRIWQRALASGNPARIEAAGHQAVRAMVCLLDPYEESAECVVPDLSKLKIGETAHFHVPSGDLHPVLDLLGLPPVTLPEMKGRILDQIMREITEGRFTMSDGQDTALTAWVFADTSEGPERLAEVRHLAGKTLSKLHDRRSLHSSHHGQRFGRLLFRFGRRSESMRFAKALGISPWARGWQFQPITRAAHTRIRQLLVKPGMVSDAWQQDPALACAAMSLPLWLTDAVSRVPALVELFNNAHACPWVFPRLYHVFQWHLALAGKQQSLREVEAISADCAVGLADNSLTHPVHP